MKPRSQNDRVLLLLKQRKAAERGLSTVEMIRIPTADGGKPITRLAARVRDLQDRGYRIRSERRLDGTSTYFLDGDPAPETAPAAGEPSGSELFDVHEFNPPPRGAYDSEAA